MSFSCTLYRISEFVFHELEAGSITSQDMLTKSKDFVTVQDSGDAILFLLRKRSDQHGSTFINEIFSPTEKIGGLSDEAFEKLVESCNYKEIDKISASTFYYLSPYKIAALNSFFRNLDHAEISLLYDANELNSKNIYPSLWTSGEDYQQAYNLFHLKSDIESLKNIFKNADKENDYILVFAG